MDDIERREIVRQGYNKVADAYAHLENEHEWPRMKWVKKLLSLLPKGAELLDLGCGSGDPADIEIAKDYNITGIDISEKQIELAITNVPAGKFIIGDFTALELPASSFNAVISFYTIEHLPRQKHLEIYEKIYKWIKPNGYLLISTEANEYNDVVDNWLGSKMFISSYGPKKNREMITGIGFEIIEEGIEEQIEGNKQIPYQWILGKKIFT